MRRAARTDGNHTEIVEAFRKHGCSVWDTSRMGEGGPDLVVGRWQRCVLVEVKDGSLPPSRRKLTPDEIKFKREWKGAYCIVENIDDVIVTVKYYLS